MGNLHLMLLNEILFLTNAATRADLFIRTHQTIINDKMPGSEPLVTSYTNYKQPWRQLAPDKKRLTRKVIQLCSMLF